MSGTKGVPFYDLEEVKALAERGCMSATNRVTRWLANHGYDPGDTMRGIILSLDMGGFRKSDEMEVLPGVVADIYEAEYDGEDWYVKLFLDSETSVVRVRVFSCCWDGTVH